MNTEIYFSAFCQKNDIVCQLQNKFDLSPIQNASSLLWSVIIYFFAFAEMARSVYDETMDTARISIKRERETRKLCQQDMAERLNMSLRSYQSLGSGETKLDIERLERIVTILETTFEDLLKLKGAIINQVVRDNACENKKGQFTIKEYSRTCITD